MTKYDTDRELFNCDHCQKLIPIDQPVLRVGFGYDDLVCQDCFDVFQMEAHAKTQSGVEIHQPFDFKEAVFNIVYSDLKVRGLHDAAEALKKAGSQ